MTPAQIARTNPKLADELTALAWECFSDAAYYDMWCVRQIGERTFRRGFHLVNGDEAKALCDMLNARSDGWRDIASAPGDGSEILLWPAIRRKVEGKVPCAVGRWSKYPDLECWDDLAVGHHNGFWKPTHWQPLPTPPETTP